MTAAPPPPPPLRDHEAEVSVHWVAGLVPLAALLAVIGVFTPWFKPQVSATVNGVEQSGDFVEDALYSFKEGRLGLVAPVVLVIVAIGVVALLRGRSSRYHRGSKSPVVNAARASLIAGVVAVAAVVAAYFLLPSQYTFTDRGREYSWDEALRLLSTSEGATNVELSQGPQLGFWLTLAGGIVAIVAGVLMLVVRKATPAAEVPAQGPPAPQWAPPPPPPSQWQPPQSSGPSGPSQ